MKIIVLLFIIFHTFLLGAINNIFYSSSCDLEKNDCPIIIDENSSISLNISPKNFSSPTNLTFTLDVKGKFEDKISIKINGKNMNMGTFPFTFHIQENGQYKANIILPSCMKGEMTWEGKIKLKKENKEIIGIYIFKTK